ncbi:glycoside hydrolase family 97 protein [Spirosoma endbachense]|uniref:Glycoside hydrolase family 97 protein n=1 Tax=Spirosoma endbachense TaxID=2666025 RepID=A0A6P1VMT1_9BACT|nr:glycoside hydrolase family 97 protein [Spirosoma endbachense]QHV94591.1 glycoside hydrolase family 97 protein [Spirosoma endbachense]
MKQISLFFLLIYGFSVSVLAQRNLRLTSPNGRIVFSFVLTKTAPTYRVMFEGKTLVDDSELSLIFQGNDVFGPNLSQAKPVVRTIDETYELVVGKVKTAQNYCQEAIIPLSEKSGARRRLDLLVRLFDDGVAFRYEFPKQANWSAYTLTEEKSTFRLAQNPNVMALFRANFTTSHEGLYTTLPLREIKNDTLMDMPALFEFPDKKYLAITEAALSDYAGMYLVRKNGLLTSQLSPLPNQTEVKVKATLPHRTPWRVLLIGDRVGTLIESNILTSLNEPSRIKDVSWLKAGKTTFPWWNGTIVPDTNFAPGNNFETNKYYIDFCADNHIDFHSVVEYGGHEWYVSDGFNYVPGPNADPAKALPGLDMQKICDYAKSRSVGIRVWVYWSALYPRIDSVFAQYERWGIKGMMVDFMDRDDQEMVNIQERILQKAAEHKLHVQFHGAYKPTGMHRTYPNELTREGTLNYEVNKWDTLVTPDHDINFPFTRMLAGATDMHLGGFRAVPADQFRVHYIRPMMFGTRCHHLAMYVVLESYLGMVADYPDAYKGQPGFDFLQQVPTTWDEIRVLAAEVSQYVSIARRSGTDWFIGSITNSTARTMTVNLDFLPEGNYRADFYADAPDVAQNPNHLTQQSSMVSRKDVLTLKLAAGGGHVMRLRKQ